MPGNVKSLVWQVSPWWKEEQHRSEHVCFLAVEEVPRQSPQHYTCNNVEDISIGFGDDEANGDGEAKK